MRLEMRDVSYRYTRHSPPVLQDVSLVVSEGERVGILAPSGYGKSTLLQLLAGYLEPQRGTVVIDGQPQPRRGRSPVHLINQHPEEAINPRWRMRRVLEEGGPLRGSVLEALGIATDWLTRFPRELSGGELQRFNVARALLSEPRFLLADEISTMLDVITQAQIWTYLLQEVKLRGAGLVVVSHNEHLVRRVCTRVIRLDDINETASLPEVTSGFPSTDRVQQSWSQ